MNNNRNLVVLKPDDIFLAKIAIQSDKKMEKVAKLSYAVRDPF